MSELSNYLSDEDKAGLTWLFGADFTDCVGEFPPFMCVPFHASGPKDKFNAEVAPILVQVLKRQAIYDAIPNTILGWRLIEEAGQAKLEVLANKTPEQMEAA